MDLVGKRESNKEQKWVSTSDCSPSLSPVFGPTKYFMFVVESQSGHGKEDVLAVDGFSLLSLKKNYSLNTAIKKIVGTVVLI